MEKQEDWKIYTRKGDAGETSLIGGTRVPKYDLRIECYGSLDELNSYIGMLRDQQECRAYSDILQRIQDRIFVAESLLASDSPESAAPLMKLESSDIDALEQAIDSMNNDLPVLTHFILPGGHPAVSWAHICRTVCRRVERLVIKLGETSNADPIVIKYLNRLSDYFFVLARRISYELGIAENTWPAKAKSKNCRKKKSN
jgi:cob(I)alamin adenosyltransferase